MSHNIEWGVCPEATHYLPSGFGPSLSTFWQLIDGAPFKMWDADGNYMEGADLALEGLFDRLIERPVIDFSRAPAGATHYLNGGPDVLWYQVGSAVWLWSGRWQLVIGMPTALLPIPTAQAPDCSKAPEGATHWERPARAGFTESSGYLKRFGARWLMHGKHGTWEYALKPSPVRLAQMVERPGVVVEPGPVVDWNEGPSDSTHWGARTDVPGEGGYKEAFYRKVGDRFDIGVWENDWYWRPAVDLEDDRLAMLIERPAAEPATVDWATAPDDATHHCGEDVSAPWRKLDGDKFAVWMFGEWQPLHFPNLSEYILRPAAEFVPRDFSGEVRDYGSAAVDWSQGPEGATAFADGRWFRDNHVWDDRHNYWAFQNGDTGDHAYEYPDAQYKPEPPIIWNGEGLPPVGVECERHASGDLWERVRIKYQQANICVWEVIGIAVERCFDRSHEMVFRPIRTPEQIAEEAREDAGIALAGALTSLMADAHVVFDKSTAAWIAAQLIEIGYSKAVEVSP